MDKEEMEKQAIELIKEFSKRDDSKPVDDFILLQMLKEELKINFQANYEFKIAIIALYKFEIEGFRI